VVATTPITQIATVPVLVPQTNPYQTLYSPCPDSPTPTQTTPTTSQTDSTTTTSPLSTIVHTQYSTYTDSNGVHTASTTISSTIDPAPITNGGSTGKSSVPLGTIIGGVVGGLVGLLVLSALVWYILWRREQNKFLFDDDDFHGAAAGGMKGNRPTALLAARNSGGRRLSRNVNLDDEFKGAEAHPYQYGVVGGSPSPNTTPSLGSGNATAGGGAYHSQPSTMGYGHQRNSSRDALMTAHSPPISPRHLDVPLPGGGGGSMGQQRRASQYTGSSGMTDTIVMANQPPVGMANPTGNDMLGGGRRVSDERDASWTMMGHQPRPSSSLLEAPVVSYPPGHGGFYQQYGPIDQPQQQQFQQQQQQQQGPVPAHQALYAAAGLGSPDFYPQGQGQGRVLASPPPGAGGARQYTTSAGVGPAGTSGDTKPSSTAVPVAATATSPNPDVGFGRQRGSAEKARESRTTGESGGVRSPVIQHLDGGRVPDGAGGAPGPLSLSGSGSGANTADGHAGDAPPPAYSDP
jgi:hypothetical protein